MNKEQAKLRGMRAEHKLTMADMAKIIGTSELTYSKKERGITDFSLSEAARIAESFGVEISDIFLS